MHKFLTLVTVPAVLSMALVAPAMARPSTATLTVGTSGSSAEATGQLTTGSSLKFGGCGYQPGVGVTVKVASPSAIAFFGGIAGSDGCFSTENTTTYTADDAGTYTASAYQSSRRKADANVTFTVTQ